MPWPLRWLPFSTLVPDITDAIFQLQLWELSDAAAAALGDPGPTLVSVLRDEEGDEVPATTAAAAAPTTPAAPVAMFTCSTNSVQFCARASHRTSARYLRAYYYTLLLNISSRGTGRVMMVALAGNAWPSAPIPESSVGRWQGKVGGFSGSGSGSGDCKKLHTHR